MGNQTHKYILSWRERNSVHPDRHRAGPKISRSWRTREATLMLTDAEVGLGAETLAIERAAQADLVTSASLVPVID